MPRPSIFSAISSISSYTFFSVQSALFQISIRLPTPTRTTSFSSFANSRRTADQDSALPVHLAGAGAGQEKPCKFSGIGICKRKCVEFFFKGSPFGIFVHKKTPVQSLGHNELIAQLFPEPDGTIKRPLASIV